MFIFDINEFIYLLQIYSRNLRVICPYCVFGNSQGKTMIFHPVNLGGIWGGRDLLTFFKGKAEQGLRSEELGQSQ